MSLDEAALSPLRSVGYLEEPWRAKDLLKESWKAVALEAKRAARQAGLESSF
jgi:hypothetical protein